MSAARKSVAGAWGDNAPDWINVLAEQCDRTSQKAAATRIGYSPATVNQVLRRKYAGDMVKVEGAVSGAYLAATVDCPVLGEVPSDQCLAHQRKPRSTSNPMRVQLYRACRSGCPHSRISTGGPT